MKLTTGTLHMCVGRSVQFDVLVANTEVVTINAYCEEGLSVFQFLVTLCTWNIFISF